MHATLTKTLLRTAAAVAFGVLAGCSGDSPTAQRQTPPPNPGGTPSTAWRIPIPPQPAKIALDATQTSTRTVRGRRADNNQPAPNGTTLVLTSTLGEFVERGSGVHSGAVETFNGTGSVLFFPGEVAGTAVITAALE